jgi:cyanophycinase
MPDATLERPMTTRTTDHRSAAQRPLVESGRGRRDVLAPLVVALALAGPFHAVLADAMPLHGRAAARADVSATTAAPESTAAGAAVAIGGALRYDNAAVWSRLVELAGGPGARFVVLATAAGNPASSAARSVAALEAHGAVAEALPVSPRLAGRDVAAAVRDPELIAKVRVARGVYFTGGAQERIVDALQPDGRASPLLEAIRELMARGGVVAGTSAGAAVMSATMFRDATDVMAVMKGSLRFGRELDRGLAFAGPDLFVDQHFLRRGRLGRLLPAMRAQGYRKGLGVEEDSAAILRGGSVEVVGAGGALYVDLAEASTDPTLGVFNLTGARLTFLGDGDRLDLASGAVTPSAAKSQGQRVDPRAEGFRPYFEDVPFLLDALADGAILRAMTLALDGPTGEVRGLAFDARPDAAPPRELGFEFHFRRGADTVGWFTSALGGEAYTVSNMRLDVTPVRVAQPLYQPWPR